MDSYILDTIKQYNLPIHQIVKIDNGKIETINITDNKLHNIYSISKNFTATAIGILIDENKLSYDTTIYSIFKNDYKNLNTLWNKVTIKDVLSQTTGIDKGFLDFDVDNISIDSNEDYLYQVLSRELVFQPGTHFCYSDSNFYLLSKVIGKVAKMSSKEFIIQRILKPLNINEYDVKFDINIDFIGGTMLFVNATAIAKLGLLYLNEGIYNNKQIISKEFVRLATSTHIIINDTTSYGYSFWLDNKKNDYFMGNGMYGQQLLVDNKNKIVYAWVASSYDSKTNILLDKIKEKI